MRLLLVEDDDRVAAALVAVLSRHGFQVRHARSGHEALDALVPDGSDPYRVVLLDLGLPDRDGFEVCSRIRAGSGVPVIMVTARADIRSRIHGLNLGADDYITKPYDMGELLARIHAVARRFQPPATGAEGGSETPNTPGSLESWGISIDRERRRVSVDGRDVPLTRKEFDLLALLAQSRAWSTGASRSSARSGRADGRATVGPWRCTSARCAPSSRCPALSRRCEGWATG